MANVQDAIEASFQQLLEQKPYKAITVSDICGRAGISRKTFYAYYSNKDDIVARIFEHDAVEPIRGLNVLLSSAETEALYGILYEKIYEQIYRNPDFYVRLVGPMRGHDDTFIRVATNAIYDLNIEILANHHYQGDSRKADYIAYFFASSQAMLIQKWISDGMPYTPKELASLYDEMTQRFWLSTFGA